MTRQPHLDPSPFLLAGGCVGVLLIHGFTGSPPEMRLIGDYLHQRGCTVAGPLLPGHGTVVDDMHRLRWTDWTSHVDAALVDLRIRCKAVFVGGLSLGSLLALYLAARHSDLAGTVLYSPAVKLRDDWIYMTPVLKHLIRKRRKAGASDLTDPQAQQRLWSYEEHSVAAAREVLSLLLRVRRLLPGVVCPLLVVHSTLDQAIHPASAVYTYERVGSSDKELVTLHNSGHALTVDSEWPYVAEKTYRFIADHLPEGVQVEG
jgi:carboxylesterase